MPNPPAARLLGDEKIGAEKALTKPFPNSSESVAGGLLSGVGSVLAGVGQGAAAFVAGPIIGVLPPLSWVCRVNTSHLSQTEEDSS